MGRCFKCSKILKTSKSGLCQKHSAGLFIKFARAKKNMEAIHSLADNYDNVKPIEKTLPKNLKDIKNYEVYKVSYYPSKLKKYKLE